ncbi:putative transposase, partial [Escherichia coli 6-319-05_S4_C3]
EKPEEAGETSATVKPQGQIQQQLAEAETQNTVSAFPYRKYPQRLPS